MSVSQLAEVTLPDTSKAEVRLPHSSDDATRYACRVVEMKKEYVLKSETVRALRGVTFDVPEGDYVAIMGPSGSGKSTLLNMLGCLTNRRPAVYF